MQRRIRAGRGLVDLPAHLLYPTAAIIARCLPLAKKRPRRPTKGDRGEVDRDGRSVAGSTGDSQRDNPHAETGKLRGHMSALPRIKATRGRTKTAAHAYQILAHLKR